MNIDDWTNRLTRTNRALDVANYVVEYSLEMKNPINHVQLQKILYYAFVTYLIQYDKRLFDDNLLKWRLGPIVKRVYDRYMGFGFRAINFIPTETVFDFKGFGFERKAFTSNVLNKSCKSFIENVFNKLCRFSFNELISMTHSHDIWKEDIVQINAGNKGILYDIDHIKEYFHSNLDLLMDLELIEKGDVYY